MLFGSVLYVVCLCSRRRRDELLADVEQVELLSGDTFEEMQDSNKNNNKHRHIRNTDKPIIVLTRKSVMENYKSLQRQCTLEISDKLKNNIINASTQQQQHPMEYNETERMLELCRQQLSSIK